MFRPKIFDLILVIIVIVAFENFAKAQETLVGHPISFYLSNQQIPQVCEDIYTHKIKIPDDPRVMALLDSIFSSNNEFLNYFIHEPILTKTNRKKKAN